MKVTEFIDYKMYLKKVFEEKMEKNSSYSLRSFADRLELSPSHLSRVLNGQKKLSAISAMKISKRLKHCSKEQNHFADLVQLEKLPEGEFKLELLEKISKNCSAGYKRILSIEQFKVISQWYHFAILALTKTKGFKSSPQWIAKRLGITAYDAKFAIDRLLELGLLKIADNNDNICAVDNGNISTTEDISSMAIRENHKQNIRKSLLALEKQNVNERVFNNCIVAIKKKNLPRIRKEIMKVFDNLNETIDTDKGEELYQFNLQFFKITDCPKELQ